MFNTLVYILVLALIGYGIWITTKYRSLHEELQKAMIGSNEIAEAYYADSLQYEESISKLQNQYEARESDFLSDHEAKIRRLTEECRQLKEIKARQASTLSEITNENLSLHADLKEARSIIQDHDSNCLPRL